MTSPPPQNLIMDENVQQEFKKKKDDILSKCKEIAKDHPNNKSCKYAISYLEESDEINPESKLLNIMSMRMKMIILNDLY